MHFVIIPALQTLTVFRLPDAFASQAKGSVQIGWVAALVAYLLIDYGWFWNHRAFHGLFLADSRRSLFRHLRTRREFLGPDSRNLASP